MEKHLFVIAIAFGNFGSYVPELAEKHKQTPNNILSAFRQFAIDEARSEGVECRVFSDIESPLPTPITVGEMVRQAKELKNEPCEIAVRVICAEPHRFRVMRDIHWMAEMEGVVFDSIQYDIGLNSFWEGVWFDERSTQAWTRSPLLWDVYEFMVQLLPFEWYIEMAKKEKDTNSRGGIF
jgi:hypothetical protein